MANGMDTDDEQRRRRAMGMADPYQQTGGESGSNPAGQLGQAGGYASGGGQQQTAPGRRGTGFINPQTYLGANMGAGQQMAQRLTGETARQGDAERAALANLAQGQMVPGGLAQRSQDTAARANLAAPQGGGLTSVLAGDYGGGSPYTSGMGAFDALLIGGAGGRMLQESANRYGGLGREVDAANKAAAAYVPPSAGAPAAIPGAAPTVPAWARAPAAPPPAPFDASNFLPEQGEFGFRPRRNRFGGGGFEGLSPSYRNPLRGGP